MKQKQVWIPTILFLILFCISGSMLLSHFLTGWQEEKAFQKIAQQILQNSSHASDQNTSAPLTTEDGILLEYASLYGQNPDLFGWIALELSLIHISACAADHGTKTPPWANGRYCRGRQKVFLSSLLYPFTSLQTLMRQAIRRFFVFVFCLKLTLFSAEPRRSSLDVYKRQPRGFSAEPAAGRGGGSRPAGRKGLPH